MPDPLLQNSTASRSSVPSLPSSYPLEDGLSSLKGSRKTSATSWSSFQEERRLTPRNARSSTCSIPSRLQWLALRLVESTLVDLDKTDVFWKNLEAQRPENGSSSHSFTYPPLFETLCICDAKIRGNPIYLQSKHFLSVHPRALYVGKAQFLNLGSSASRPGGEIKMLSSNPAADGTPAFSLEVGLPLVPTMQAQDETSDPILVASLPLTDQILDLSRILMETYGPDIGNLALSAGPSAADDEVDWIHASKLASRPFDSVLNRVPFDDRTIVELHRFFFDLVHFHRDFLVLQIADKNWQITHASPALGKSCDGWLDTPPFRAPDDLSEKLANPEAFCIDILWGRSSDQKQMYSVPLYRRDTWACWACFILGHNLPRFWTKNPR